MPRSSRGMTTVRVSGIAAWSRDDSQASMAGALKMASGSGQE
jgi:hypothetical protein